MIEVREVLRRFWRRAIEAPHWARDGCGSQHGGSLDQRLSLSAHREHIERWLQHDELKLSKVHVLRKRQAVDVSYATLRRYVMDELAFGLRTPTVRLDDPPPGEEAQIDFGLMGLMRDRVTDRTRKLWARW
jgi:hypothetical protein